MQARRPGDEFESSESSPGEASPQKERSEGGVAHPFLFLLLLLPLVFARLSVITITVISSSAGSREEGLHSSHEQVGPLVRCWRVAAALKAQALGRGGVEPIP